LGEQLLTEPGIATARDSREALHTNATPVGMSWMWTLAFGHHEDRSPVHGYAETREAAMGHSPRAGGGDSRPFNCALR
jgi:hypothetical protein